MTVKEFMYQLKLCDQNREITVWINDKNDDTDHKKPISQIWNGHVVVIFPEQNYV